MVGAKPGRWFRSKSLGGWRDGLTFPRFAGTARGSSKVVDVAKNRDARRRGCREKGPSHPRLPSVSLDFPLAPRSNLQRALSCDLRLGQVKSCNVCCKRKKSRFTSGEKKGLTSSTRDHDLPDKYYIQTWWSHAERKLGWISLTMNETVEKHRIPASCGQQIRFL